MHQKILTTNQNSQNLQVLGEVQLLWGRQIQGGGPEEVSVQLWGVWGGNNHPSNHNHLPSDHHDHPHRLL